MELNKSLRLHPPVDLPLHTNPAFRSSTPTDIYMAVDFISSKMPTWKAITTRLKSKPKPDTPKRVNLDQVNLRKLGPGSYKVKTLENVASHRFSSLPRFANSEKLKISVPSIEKPSKEVKLRGKILYYKNIDSSPHSKTNRMLRLKASSESRIQSKTIVKQTRVLLYEAGKSQKIDKIKKKEIKFNRWAGARLFVQAEKGWLVLMACLAVSQMANLIRIKRKEFKSAFIFNSKWLYQVALAVGKFASMLKRIRKDRAFRVINNCFLPMVKQKMKQLVGRYTVSIAHTLEMCLTRRLFKRVLQGWRRKYSKLENGLRTIVQLFQYRLDNLTLYWNKIQYKYSLHSSRAELCAEESRKLLLKYLLGKIKDFYRVKLDFKRNLMRIQVELDKYSSQKAMLGQKRKKGIIMNIGIGFAPIFRIYNKEEIIRLYLEEEKKHRQIPETKESSLTLEPRLSDKPKSSHLREALLRSKSIRKPFP
jgi:hypothetical protein